MTGASLALLLALLVGFPLARRLDRSGDWPRVTGLALLLGVGVVACVMLLLSVAGVRWGVGSVLLGVVVVAMVPLWDRTNRTDGTDATALSVPSIPSVLSVPSPIDAVTAATLLGYALFATGAPPFHQDFINNWGLKAHVFHLAGGIDWAFLQHRWYKWIHPDYPLLVPLTLDWMALFAGEWLDHTAGLLHAAMAVGVLLIARSFFLEEAGGVRFAPHLAALATLMLAPLVVAPFAGIGDTPLAVFALAAVLYLRRGHVTTGAILLGLAALTKNEGIALIGVVALAMLADARLRRHLLRLWPAAAIAVPWLVIRTARGLQTDITEGSALSRIVEHLPQFGALAGMLARYGGWVPLFWAGVAVALLAGGLRLLRDERFVLLVIVLQLAFYVVAYLATPYDLDWHVKWSFERLVGHLTPMLAWICATVVLRPRSL